MGMGLSRSFVRWLSWFVGSQHCLSWWGCRVNGSSYYFCNQKKLFFLDSGSITMELNLFPGIQGGYA